MVLLARIVQAPAHGYALLLQLEQLGSPLFAGIREGTLYPILYRLEDGGLITSQRDAPAAGGRIKKVYRATEAGHAALRQMRAFWADYKTCIDHLMEENNG